MLMVKKENLQNFPIKIPKIFYSSKDSFASWWLHSHLAQCTYILLAEGCECSYQDAEKNHFWLLSVCPFDVRVIVYSDMPVILLGEQFLLEIIIAA